MTRPTDEAIRAALREINAAYNALPAAERPEVGWTPADDALETALRSGDESRTLAVVAAWRRLNLDLIEEAR